MKCKNCGEDLTPGRWWKKCPDCRRATKDGARWAILLSVLELFIAGVVWWLKQ